MDAPPQISDDKKLIPLRRVGIVGDVHAQDQALASALAFLHALPKSLDAVLCSGDLVTGDGDANEAIRLLRDAKVVTVRGNHDRWFDKPYYSGLPFYTPRKSVDKFNQSFLFGLRPERAFNTVSGPLLLCHGVGDDDMAGVYPGGPDDEIAWMLQRKRLDRFRYVVSGHTHTRMVRPITNADESVTTLINAGTLLPDKTPGFLVCDFSNETATVYRVSPDFSVSEGKTVGLRPEFPTKD